MPSPALCFVATQYPGSSVQELCRRLPGYTNSTVYGVQPGGSAFSIGILPQRVAKCYYLQRLDGHKSHLPLEGFGLLAEALQRRLDAEGDRRALGDPNELREAVDRVEAYQAFQPDRFDRRALNRQLRALAHEGEVRP